MSANQTPAISVILPAYNVTKYIAEALESVLAQTFQDFEIVVVNDGSPDTIALEEALQPYWDRIVYVKKENGGLASARNAGIAAARAPLVALLDPDDAFLPDYLESQARVLRENPSAAAVFPDGVIFGDTPQAGSRITDRSPCKPPVTLRRVLQGACNMSYCCLARKSAIVRAGCYDAQLRSCEDFDLYLRLLLAGESLIFNPRPLFRYRKRGDSLSADDLAMKKWALQVYGKLELALPAGSEDRRLVAEVITGVHSMIEVESGKQALRRRDWELASRHFKAHQKVKPTWKVAAVLILLQVSPRILAWAVQSRDRMALTR